MPSYRFITTTIRPTVSAYLDQVAECSFLKKGTAVRLEEPVPHPLQDEYTSLPRQT